MDLDTHKRKIFIQKLSPQTTEQSLKDYFSKYPIDICRVPLDESGKAKMHAIVIFFNEESVNAVMSQRSHTIDGKEVLIHRSVPNQGPLKENKTNQDLLVSSSSSRSLVESDIDKYFSQYGIINRIKSEDNTWVIHFD